MPASRNPGPITTTCRVEDGTLARTASPVGGVAGQRVTSDDVSRWPLSQKLKTALRRTANKLPESMRAQFMGLLTPENIGITVGVLGIWVGSHAFGVGEVADAIMAIVGAVTMGLSAFTVANDIRKFAVTTGMAKTQRDLDLAAGYLADAVSIIGVTAFAAVIAKGAGKIRPAPAEVPVRSVPVPEVEPLVPRDVAPQRLYQMVSGMEGDGAMAQALRRAALDDLYQDHPKLYYKGMMYDEASGKFVRSRPAERRASHIDGTDLTQPIIARTLRPGEIIIAYQRMGGQPGTYMARVGTPAERLGISVLGRFEKRYQVTSPLDLVESTAADIAAGRAAGVGGKGGAQQYIMPPDWEKKTRAF